MGVEEIPDLLDARLAALAGLPAFARTNQQFVPAIGTPYVATTWLPAEPVVLTIGLGETYLHRGIHQVSVFVPAGEGWDANVKGLVGSILTWFKDFSATLSDGTSAVRILKAYPAKGLDEDSWYHVPISLSYQLFTT